MQKATVISKRTIRVFIARKSVRKFYNRLLFLINNKDIFFYIINQKDLSKIYSKIHIEKIPGKFEIYNQKPTCSIQK